MIIFRYKSEAAGFKNQTIKRPVANVFLQAKTGEWIEFEPYIDSGADVTLIPFSLGKLLGQSFAKKEIQEIGGIRGSLPVVYFKNKIRLGEISFDILIGWALIEEVPPLLGRANVFDKFDITFKQKEETIIFAEKL